MKSLLRPMQRPVTKNLAILVAALFLITASAPSVRAADDESEAAKRTAPRKREFRFIYGATITGLKPNQPARIWIPVATDSPWQKVQRVKTSLPGSPCETVEEKFKNKLLYTQATANAQGEIPIEVVYDVVRSEFVSKNSKAPPAKEQKKFLAANKRVPVDGSIQQRLLKQERPAGDTMTVGRALYDVVNDQMRYDKPAGKPWGRGDALWACDNGYGNCTDFHSLFIGLCRDMKIPAKFEIGFPIPSNSVSGEVGGYHCWAMFADSDRWVAVDISEADKHPEMTDYYFGRLTPDRLTFTTGRDLELVPAQQAGPVNFLVYPYVEVDGKQHTQFKKQFRFEKPAP